MALRSPDMESVNRECLKCEWSSCCVRPFAAKSSDGHDPLNARSLDGHVSDGSSDSDPAFCV